MMRETAAEAAAAASPELKITVSWMVRTGRSAVSFLIAVALKKYGVVVEVVDRDGEVIQAVDVPLRMRTLAANGLKVTIDQQTLQRGGTFKNPDIQ